jgi:hypothetical protein
VSSRRNLADHPWVVHPHTEALRGPGYYKIASFAAPEGSGNVNTASIEPDSRDTESQQLNEGIAAMKTFALVVTSFIALAPIHGQAASTTIQFPLRVSPGASTCLPHASATVIDHSFGEFENLEVVVRGLPPKTAFDLFSIEVPNAPFGLAWYIGDIVTDETGAGVGNFVGRFNVETFVISTGVPASPPPNVFHSPPAVVPEATVGVKTNPVQLYHLGLWFNSAANAASAGCPGTHTPFNGEHNAGIQVMNTANFPDATGPLFSLK